MRGNATFHPALVTLVDVLRGCAPFLSCLRTLPHTDPFGQDFPEVIEDWLVSKSAVNCVFNKRGTLLAVGCNDGEVIIWDFDTRGIAKQWKAHIGTVTSVRYGHACFALERVSV